MKPNNYSPDRFGYCENKMDCAVEMSRFLLSRPGRRIQMLMHQLIPVVAFGIDLDWTALISV